MAIAAQHAFSPWAIEDARQGFLGAASLTVAVIMELPPFNPNVPGLLVSELKLSLAEFREINTPQTRIKAITVIPMMYISPPRLICRLNC